MRGVLLWLIGIPLPIILLLYLFNLLKGAAGCSSRLRAGRKAA